MSAIGLKLNPLNPLGTKQIEMIEMRYSGISFGCSDYHTSRLRIVSSNQFASRQVPLVIFLDELDMTNVMTRQ
jgi:hypothetical protein